MTAQEDDLVALYDKAPLNARYWISMVLAAMTSIFDFFDFFIVGFLVAMLAPQWQLTFGQTSVMLLSAGVGAIVGALAWGALSDLWGRKTLLVAGVALCAVGAGCVSLIPDVALQGQETRHAKLIRVMVDRYVLDALERPIGDLGADIETSFKDFGFGTTSLRLANPLAEADGGGLACRKAAGRTLRRCHFRVGTRLRCRLCCRSRYRPAAAWGVDRSGRQSRPPPDQAGRDRKRCCPPTGRRSGHSAPRS